MIEFARDVLGVPLDPWQEWLVIHAGELLEDGRPRFRTILALVSRQNGKTHLLSVLALYWLFVEECRMILGTSTTLATAKEAWLKALTAAQESPILAPITARPVMVNGQETLLTTSGCRYKIAASTRLGGRGLTVDRLIVDEVREHRTWDAWNASTNAQNAVINAQTWAISNQGDDSSVVLDALRSPALTFIETGVGDPRLGLFEWSAPDDADPTDPEALAAANPNYGHRIDPDALLGAALRAKEAGGEELAGFKTEVMCQRVHLIDPAIDPDSWARCATEVPINLAEHRSRVALCVDISLDGSHGSLVAAAVLDGKVHTEVVAAWDGWGCSKQVRAELPDIVAKVKPAVVGWFPAGPAAAIAAQLRDLGGRGRTWPPRGVDVDEIKGDVVACCMGLAEQVRAGELVHPADPMLTAHVAGTTKLRRGEAWVFARVGTGAIDGAYALAGAVHLARTMPAPRAPLTVL